jgi:AcrR family transcriptional regulator
MARTASGVETTVAGAPRETYRDRRRRERRQEFLDIALRIVATEGLQALVMKRITEELDCSETSIYVYFPTKGALIAEVQANALMTLARSLAVSQAELERRLDGKPEPFVALARIVGASRFWVAAETMFPREIELCRMLFGTPTEVMSQDEGDPAVSPAMQLVELGRQLLEHASATGAMVPGDAYERATVILAGSAGVLLAGSLARWDARIVDSRSFADRMLTTLFLGWGADPALLAEVDALLGEMARVGALVPADPGA